MEEIYQNNPPPKPDGFKWISDSSRDFPVAVVSIPVDTLVDLWDEEMTQAVDTLSPRCPLSNVRSWVTLLFTEGVKVRQIARMTAKEDSS